MAKAKSELVIKKGLQELIDLRDALDLAIGAMEIVAGQGHGDTDDESEATSEPEVTVNPPKDSKKKPAAASKTKAAAKAAPEPKEREVPKEPPGRPKVSMRDTIVGMIKAGTTRTALEKMLETAIKKPASEADIFEIRQAIGRYDLWDGDKADMLTAYDEHEDDAKEIEIGKSTTGQLSATKQAEVDERDEGEEPEEEESSADDPDDKF